MQKLFQRYREQREPHASTRIKDVLKEIQKEEEFGDELLSNLINRAKTLEKSIVELPKGVPYPSLARDQLISFLQDLNEAIIQRLQSFRASSPSTGFSTIETHAKRLGQILNLLFGILEYVVHSEPHRIPSPIIAPLL